eukprot:scaffold69920_cov73-Phaeocystis_antarctica.AAC.1
MRIVPDGTAGSVPCLSNEASFASASRRRARSSELYRLLKSFFAVLPLVLAGPPAGDSGFSTDGYCREGHLSAPPWVAATRKHHRQRWRFVAAVVSICHGKGEHEATRW